MTNLPLLITASILLLGAGIWLSLKKKYHVFYFIACGIFLITFFIQLNHVLPQSSMEVEAEGLGPRDMTGENIRATLFSLMIGLLCVMPVLSFVNFFVRPKNVFAIVLSCLMLVFCAVLFAIWYFLAHLGKIGG